MTSKYLWGDLSGLDLDTHPHNPNDDVFTLVVDAEVYDAAVSEIDRLRAMSEEADIAVFKRDVRVTELEMKVKELRQRLELDAAAFDALAWIKSADHVPGCPRIRDDYDCTCGRDEAIEKLNEALK